jgi:hypothetical protein
LPIRRIGLPPATAPGTDLFFVRLMVGARIRDLFLSEFLILGVAFAQLFEMRTHVSRTRKFRRPAARKGRAQNPAAAALATSATRAGHALLSGWLRRKACAAHGYRAQDFGRCRGAEGAPGIGRNRTQFWFVPKTYPSSVTWSTTKCARTAAGRDFLDKRLVFLGYRDQK